MIQTTVHDTADAVLVVLTAALPHGVTRRHLAQQLGLSSNQAAHALASLRLRNKAFFVGSGAAIKWHSGIEGVDCGQDLEPDDFPVRRSWVPADKPKPMPPGLRLMSVFNLGGA